jgi:3-oxoacyl-[acyl-carrier protein] reductase
LSFSPLLLAFRGGRLIEDGRDIPTSEFDKMMDINLKASFLLVKGVVGGMKDRKWGRIIFISSIAAYGAGINGCRTYRSSTLIP